MRVLAVLTLFVVATNYLGIIIRGVEGANIHFSPTGATSRTYSNFLQMLRNQLKVGTTLVSHGIPVLRKNVAVVSQRFILVDLSNYDDRTITVAIDVVNAYVVGYRTDDNRSYFFKEDKSKVPVDTLFQGTKRVDFTFTGSYRDLQGQAKKERANIPLGASNLSEAVDRLLDKQYKLSAVAISLIVIIQMVSEAARFGFIESQIGLIINDGTKSYKPGSSTLDMENNWSVLSNQIQMAGQNGVFVKNNTVKIGDTKVSNVQTAKTVTGIALLLDRSLTAGVDVEPTVSFIIGYNDLCMQANRDNSRVWLKNCALDGRQRWALYGDDTIRVNSDRSLCVTSVDVGGGIIIRKCEGVGNQRWVFRTDGSILNPNANLVMGVKESNVDSRHHIILNQPNGQPNQKWRVRRP